MHDTTAIASVPPPSNEPVLGYAPGSAERVSLEQRLTTMAKDRIEAPMLIAGREVAGDSTFQVVAPHRRDLVLAEVQAAGPGHVQQAIDAALAAAPAWRAMPWEERAGLFLRAADLLAGPWRDTLNAATILGQSKSVYQAEIDAACELIDFWRFNVAFAAELYAQQPVSAKGVWNRMDYRPLEGFVLALTPFNFTSIAANLPTAPALMGNVVVWKPSEKSALAAHWAMELLRAAGLPDGVINLVHGDGAMAVDVATSSPEFAGLHFTGSTDVFRGIWATVGQRLPSYRSYPRLVGETGGKDFVVAHPSADVDRLIVALGLGAFEYQGQKCSAASRAYVPRSLWEGGVRDRLAATADSLAYGDVTDFTNFGGAVIDARAFAKHAAALDAVKNSDACTVLAGGTADDSEGYFVRPTVVECTDPTHEVFTTEYFGPILGVYVFDDAAFAETVRRAEGTSPYGLTGALFATDRKVIDWASSALRYAAGNFYINDKPTGAVVGQQPFGGARASGTNDKSGSWHNLVRWTSPRAIKETFVPPTDHTYPHMAS